MLCLQVLDQYLSFISPSPSLFSILPPVNAPPASAPNAAAGPSTTTQPFSSYTLLNSPSSTEQQIEEEIERIATGLFSVVVTMGQSILTLPIRDVVLREESHRPRSHNPSTSRKCRRDDSQEARAEDSRCNPVLCAFAYIFVIRARRIWAVQPSAAT